MANDSHVAILRQGVDAWNRWRAEDRKSAPDLTNIDLDFDTFDGADFRDTGFEGANLSGEVSFNHVDFRGSRFDLADLSISYFIESDFRGCQFYMTKFDEADLAHADFRKSQIHSSSLLEANLSGADLRKAELNYSDLSHACLRVARLQKADLTAVKMVGTDLSGADLSGCRIWGISPWDVNLEDAKQDGLVITRAGEPPVQVDALELAQFVNLLLDNQKLRRIIDTLTSRVVLVIGEFGTRRRGIIEAIRRAIRERGLLPLVVDLDGLADPDPAHTVTLLARVARYVVADLQASGVVARALDAFVPDVAVPVIRLVPGGQTHEPGGTGAWRYPWLQKPVRYTGAQDLERVLARNAFDNAEKSRLELHARRGAATAKL
jgi:uncharacterized protein YjbI with pentapeptide repeats